MIETPEISRSNAGGVEIQLSPKANRLLLDTGMSDSSGTPGFVSQSRSSTFMDSQGRHCMVPNSAIFTKEGRYEARVKYQRDSDLFSYLRTACPQLRLPKLGTEFEGTDKTVNTAHEPDSSNRSQIFLPSSGAAQ
jgi:hypothetical protein